MTDHAGIKALKEEMQRLDVGFAKLKSEEAKLKEDIDAIRKRLVNNRRMWDECNEAVGFLTRNEDAQKL